MGSSRSLLVLLQWLLLNYNFAVSHFTLSKVIFAGSYISFGNISDFMGIVQLVHAICAQAEEI